MASLSTCHLGLWLGWLILLNLVKSYIKYQLIGKLTVFIIKSDSCASRAWNICKITVAVLHSTVYKGYKLTLHGNSRTFHDLSVCINNIIL